MQNTNENRQLNGTNHVAMRVNDAGLHRMRGSATGLDRLFIDKLPMIAVFETRLASVQVPMAPLKKQPH
jgi:hypothetical protein